MKKKTPPTMLDVLLAEDKALESVLEWENELIIELSKPSKKNKTMQYTYHGIDASNETSLLEYGLLVSDQLNEDGSGTRFVVYRQGDGYFGTGHVSEQDLNDLLSGLEWISKKDVVRFLIANGTKKSDWFRQRFVNKLNDLINYFGAASIIGLDYNPMTEAEAVERFLSIIY